MTWALGEYIEFLRNLKDMSVTELARRSGLSRNAIYLLQSAPGDPKLSTIEALAKAFDMKAGDLLSAMGYTNNPKLKDVTLHITLRTNGTYEVSADELD